jgi:glycerophosphoryl diester phosphodiesterase
MSIFAELKRRNVFRVALLYMVAAWLILQVADVLFGQLGIPGWALRFVFALLVICFPLLLLFSWVCEITPEGLRRGQHVEPEASITAHTGRKINHITLVLLIFTILTAVVGQLLPETTTEQALPVLTEPEDQALRATGPGSGTRQVSIDLQGHRGARGLLPENTIPAFLHALDLGVTTLEMDIAINAEGNAVLSHEPWMSAVICTHPDGRNVSEEEETTLRIFAMSDEEVAAFDCGSRGHPDFPQQQPTAVSKPLLADVLQAVATHSAETGREPVLFNIEIKSLPEGDRIFHPEVAEFAEILYRTVKSHGTLARTTVQSFDPRALEATHKLDAQVSTALLVENSDGFQKNIARLSFVPDIYSPNQEFVDQALVNAAHAQNIQVIPWTVNDEKRMRELVEMGIDGLITDYPDLGAEVLAEIQKGR